MSLTDFLEKVKKNQKISFNETISIIADNYNYQPTEFSNGTENKLVNQAGTNEGSCKIFAFAKMNQLDQQQTLRLFGDFYTIDVLQNPQDTSHQNIRNFIRYSWQGIEFKGQALTAK